MLTTRRRWGRGDWERLRGRRGGGY